MSHALRIYASGLSIRKTVAAFKRLRGIGGNRCVKNCHFSRTPGLAKFPDCKAQRSTRPLEDLAAQVRVGHRAVVLFVVQREDCETFSACADLDPAFARGLDAAAKAGVEVLVYACAMSAEAVRIERRIAWANAHLTAI